MKTNTAGVESRRRSRRLIQLPRQRRMVAPPSRGGVVSSCSPWRGSSRCVTAYTRSIASDRSLPNCPRPVGPPRRIPRPTTGPAYPGVAKGAQVSELAYGLWTNAALAVAIAVGPRCKRPEDQKDVPSARGRAGPRGRGGAAQDTVSAGPPVGRRAAGRGVRGRDRRVPWRRPGPAARIPTPTAGAAHTEAYYLQRPASRAS